MIKKKIRNRSSKIENKGKIRFKFEDNVCL
jgi:hypothetical protein